LLKRIRQGVHECYREGDFIGNKVPENMIAAEERLELLSNATVRDAERLGRETL